MVAFLLRFFAAGLLVASVPLIAAQFGDRSAGMILLFPLVTVLGLSVLGMDRGNQAVAEAAISAVWALPAVLVFLLAVHWAAGHGLPLAITLGIGVAAWVLAGLLAMLASTRPGGHP